jgi:nitrogen fixation-related uncharacterized protein
MIVLDILYYLLMLCLGVVAILAVVICIGAFFFEQDEYEYED